MKIGRKWQLIKMLFLRINVSEFLLNLLNRKQMLQHSHMLSDINQHHHMKLNNQSMKESVSL